jgi:hypothetical protein
VPARSSCSGTTGGSDRFDCRILELRKYSGWLGVLMSRARRRYRSLTKAAGAQRWPHQA